MRIRSDSYTSIDDAHAVEVRIDRRTVGTTFVLVTSALTGVLLSSDILNIHGRFTQLFYQIGQHRSIISWSYRNLPDALAKYVVELLLHLGVSPMFFAIGLSSTVLASPKFVNSLLLVSVAYALSMVCHLLPYCFSQIDSVQIVAISPMIYPFCLIPIQSLGSNLPAYIARFLTQNNWLQTGLTFLLLLLFPLAALINQPELRAGTTLSTMVLIARLTRRKE